MVVLIQESETQTWALYPATEKGSRVKLEGDYACISFLDEETGKEVTVQLHKGSVLSIANHIKDNLVVVPPF